MRAVTALIAGLLFGGGLLLSGMTNPAVVLAFLDVSGHWNPALAFTMTGAIAVAMPAFLYVRRGSRTLRGEPVTLPNRTRIDATLVTGSTVFGIGWGLSGICPGPGIIILAGGSVQAFVFVAAMAAGMLASPWLGQLTRRLAPVVTTAKT